MELERGLELAGSNVLKLKEEGRKFKQFGFKLILSLAVV